MIVFSLLLLSVSASTIDINDAKKYSPEERRNIAIDLIGEKKYEEALYFAQGKNLTGCIKILKGDIIDGMEDIEESAAKGNVFSCNLFVLYKLEVEQREIKTYIKRELEIADSTYSFESPYLRYLALDPENLYVQNSSSDSLMRPYIIFKLGMLYVEKNPEKASEYFGELIENYPGSAPAIVVRNMIRVIENKTERDKKRR